MMTSDEILVALNKYVGELEGIRSRFHHSRNAISIDAKDFPRVRGLVVEVCDLLNDHVPASRPHVSNIQSLFNEGISNYYNSPSLASVEQILEAVRAAAVRIERIRGQIDSQVLQPISARDGEKQMLDALDQLVLRFHAVVVQLRHRHSGRATLDVQDEYDVQDLLHGLLRIVFYDVRAEEVTPSYAGKSSRTDFWLPQIDTVVETKMTRPGLGAKELGDQLIIDIARYRQIQKCRRLLCFVYDPEGRVRNARGFEADLNRGGHGIDVRVAVYPAHS
jgi:hypothetical protein